MIKQQEKKENKQNKFAAIREIWSDLHENLKKCYTLGSSVTIDVQLCVIFVSIFHQNMTNTELNFAYVLMLILIIYIRCISVY